MLLLFQSWSYGAGLRCLVQVPVHFQVFPSESNGLHQFRPILRSCTRLGRVQRCDFSGNFLISVIFWKFCPLQKNRRAHFFFFQEISKHFRKFGPN